MYMYVSKQKLRYKVTQHGVSRSILVSPFYKFIICKYETTSKSELVFVLCPSMLKSNSRIEQIYLLSISREEQWGELVPFYWNVTYVYLRYQYSKQRQTDRSFPTAIRTPNPHNVIVVTISTRIKVGVFVTNSMYYNFPELE